MGGKNCQECGAYVELDADDLVAAVKERDAEIARLRAAQFLPMGDNHHNALLCPYCDGVKAVATAVKSRDEEIEALTALLIAQETHSTEGARRAERERLKPFLFHDGCGCTYGSRGEREESPGCRLNAALSGPVAPAPAEEETT